MEELFNLTYKDEVEVLKEEDNFEELGDAKYLNHKDMEARLYWAFCRPNGSCAEQICDSDPLVSIMAFNHSKLNALKRFQFLNKEVIEKDNLRTKIRNRTRMLFRSLVDNDFKELNEVLDLVPVFLPVAVDQLKNGRKWNDINADEIEVTKFIKKAQEYLDDDFFEALFFKLKDVEDFDSSELKDFLNEIIPKKEKIDKRVLEYYQREVALWCKNSDIHILQKKGIEKLSSKLTFE